MDRSSLITALLLLSVLSIAVYFTYQTMQNSDREARENSPAAQALKNSTSSNSFTDFAGNTVDLTEYLGQTLIVTSWASWAPASQGELTMLAGVGQQYQAQGVVMIGINRAESQVVAEQYLATLGLTDTVQLIVDRDDRYYQAVGGYTMPETIVYDIRGEVVLHKRGPLSAAELELTLRQLLPPEDQSPVQI